MIHVSSWSCFALITVLAFSVVLVNGILESTNLPTESILKSDLLRHYDLSVRPVRNLSSPTRVVVDLALQQIIDVNEKLQILKATFWMRVYWKDEFLTWNTSQYDGISSLKFTPSKLWLPDICLYEALQPAVHANEMQDFFISVDSEGNIMWLSPIVVEAVCHYNVRFFPYDTQFCTIQVGSWMYHGFEIDIYSRSTEGDTDNFKQNVEWEVTDFPAKRVVSYFNCCPQPYPVIDFTLVLKRRPGYYVTYLYMPSVVIIIASLFAFYLPPGSDSKVDLAVTGLLSQTVFLLLISDLMPPDAHNPPLLGKCLSILLIIQAAAVVVTVIIKRIHDDAFHKTESPSQWLFKLMHHLKYPFLLGHIDYQKHIKRANIANDSEQSGSIFRSLKKMCWKPSKTESITVISKKSDDGYRDVSTGNGHVKPTLDQNDISVTDLETDKYNKSKSLKDLGCGKTGPMTKVEALLTEVLKEMNTLLEKTREQNREDEIAEQWRHVAAMYDRIMMVAFMLSVIGITVWFVNLSPSAEIQRDS